MSSIQRDSKTTLDDSEADAYSSSESSEANEYRIEEPADTSRNTAEWALIILIENRA